MSNGIFLNNQDFQNAILWNTGKLRGDLVVKTINFVAWVVKSRFKCKIESKIRWALWSENVLTPGIIISCLFIAETFLFWIN